MSRRRRRSITYVAMTAAELVKETESSFKRVALENGIGI
jgi:hypothetical protein